MFNNVGVSSIQTYFSKLSYNKHLDEKVTEANLAIGIIKRLYNYLPRKVVIQIYKSFIHPHLEIR